MSVGWICVSFFTMIVALSMAEIVSAIPTSGGPYFWSAMLAPKRHSAFAAWITAWFNLLGQVAVTTGISFGCAQLISTVITIRGSYIPTASKTIGIYAALLISHAIINTIGGRLIRYFNNASILLNSIGVASFAIATIAKAPQRQSAKFVFATFYDGTGDPGWSVRASPAFVAVCGVLMSQYTILGFDASAHLSEETEHAAWNAAMGILTAVGASSLFGFFLIMSLLFSIQDFTKTVKSDIGQPVIQILLDIFGKNGAVVLMVLVILCIWHCGLFSMTSNSRMMFAFARDNGIPRYFAQVNPRSQSPIRTVWLAAILSFLLAIPSLGSLVAFSAATSIATIGLYLSYGIPILMGGTYHKTFRKGPFNLRSLSRVAAMISSCWIGFLTVVLCLPQETPVDSQTLNYAPVAIGIVALWAFGSWYFWAKKWFVGPVRQTQVQRAGHREPEGVNMNVEECMKLKDLVV